MTSGLSHDNTQRSVATPDQPSVTNVIRVHRARVIARLNVRIDGDPMDRRDKALAYLDVSGRGLKIGPSYSPLLPKSSGAKIETVDHASRAELVRSFGVTACQKTRSG